jgi:hypothetical protein
MIQANELRVGNWIDFISTPGEYEQVSDINTKGLKWHTINRISIEDIKGIELSSDILKKAGFDVDDDNILYLSMYSPGHPSARFCLESNGEGFTLRSRYETYNEHARFIHLKYLHQLQNLFFALTETELTLSL